MALIPQDMPNRVLLMVHFWILYSINVGRDGVLRWYEGNNHDQPDDNPKRNTLLDSIRSFAESCC
jgi:hypothetical protein